MNTAVKSLILLIGWVAGLLLMKPQAGLFMTIVGSSVISITYFIYYRVDFDD